MTLDANELVNVLRMLFEFDRRSHLALILKDTQIAMFTVMVPALCELLRAHEPRQKETYPYCGMNESAKQE